MEEKMEKLKRILGEIKQEWIEESSLDDAEYEYFVRWPSEVYTDTLEELCCTLFIASGGRPNYANIAAFNKSTMGFNVGPGETDSFGWLSGVITMHGDTTLVYCFG